MAGGKGVNVARALKLLDRPVIATGLAGGPTGARLMERLGGGIDPYRLHLDRRRVEDQPRRRRSHLRRTDRDQRAWPRGQRRGARAVPREGSTWREARDLRDRRQSPRPVPASFSARIVEELKELGVETIVDTEGEPLLASLRAGPAAVTPNVREAEGAVGHEFNDREDAISGLRSLVELGADRSRDHATGGLPRVGAGGRRPAACLRGDRPPGRAGRHRRLGRCLPGRFVAPVSTVARRRSASALRSPAARSRRSTSARAASTPPRSSACCRASRPVSSRLRRRSSGAAGRELRAYRRERVHRGAARRWGRVDRCYPWRGVGEGPPKRRYQCISGPATRGFFVRERT